MISGGRSRPGSLAALRIGGDVGAFAADDASQPGCGLAGPADHIPAIAADLAVCFQAGEPGEEAPAAILRVRQAGLRGGVWGREDADRTGRREL